MGREDLRMHLPPLLTSCLLPHLFEFPNSLCLQLLNTQTLMHSHITQRRKKNCCKTTSKQLISFVMVSRTLISSPLRPCFLLNKNQGRSLTVLFLKGSVQHYNKSLKVIHPGTLHKHRRYYRNKGHVLITPKGCSPVSFGLTPGSPFRPESGCAIPPWWVCAP